MGITCAPLWESFAVHYGDHLGSIMGIIWGLLWGSFGVHYRDHLGSNMGIISVPGSFTVQFGIICGPGMLHAPEAFARLCETLYRRQFRKQ